MSKYIGKQAYTPEEIDKMLRFLLEKAKETTTPLNLTATWQEFKELVKSERTVFSIMNKFHSDVARKIHEMENFTDEEKLRLLFASAKPCNMEFLEKLRESADLLETDDRNIIVGYRKDDLVLSKKDTRQRRRRRKRTRQMRESIDLECENDSGSIQLSSPIEISKKIKLEEFENDNIYQYPESSSECSHKLISVKKMLKFLVNFINFIGSPQLEALRLMIEGEMWRREFKHPIPVHFVRLSVETILGMTLPNALQLGDIEMMSSRFLLKFLRSTMISWKIAELEDLIEKVNRAIRQVHEEKCSLNNIRVALEMILTVIVIA